MLHRVYMSVYSLCWCVCTSACDGDTNTHFLPPLLSLSLLSLLLKRVLFCRNNIGIHITHLRDYHISLSFPLREFCSSRVRLLFELASHHIDLDCSTLPLNSQVFARDTGTLLCLTVTVCVMIFSVMYLDMAAADCETMLLCNI